MQKLDVQDQKARKIAKTYMGDVAWPTVILGCVVFASYFATPLLVANGILPLFVALPIMVLLTYAAYTVMHEAAHGSINGSQTSLRWLNELMGYGAGLVFMVPLTAHRHEHLAHHRNTNDPEMDPDYPVSGISESGFRAAKITLSLLWSNYRYYIKHRWNCAPKSQNLRFCLEIALAVGLRLVFMAQGLWFEGFVLFFLGGLGGAILLMYLFAYLPHRPYNSTERYENTATFVIPGVFGKLVTVLWGFQNYHSIHHLFPRVPFYKYRAVFDEIEETMAAKRAPVHHWRPSQASVYPMG
ncbi:MAG: fatty acid desaturase [Halioglobus sp.]